MSARKIASEGRMKIAQHFSAGFHGGHHEVPTGLPPGRAVFPAL